MFSQIDQTAVKIQKDKEAFYLEIEFECLSTRTHVNGHTTKNGIKRFKQLEKPAMKSGRDPDKFLEKSTKNLKRGDPLNMAKNAFNRLSADPKRTYRS